MQWDGPLDWHEGLFLLPHHLQLQQRFLLDRMASDRRLGFSFPSGVIEAQVSEAALANKKVQFTRLRAILPSGLEIDVPGNTDLPELNIERQYNTSSQALTVYLAVPIFKEGRPNTAASPETTVRTAYLSAVCQKSDENTGDNTQPLRLRRMNAVLLLEEDDRTDMDCLPVLRVAHDAKLEQDTPCEDPTFIPPSLVLGGSRLLRSKLASLCNQVETARADLVGKLQRAAFAIEGIREGQFEQVYRLRTLNHYAARLPTLLLARGTTPLDMYLELRGLLGELAALTPGTDPFDVQPYDHESPAICFGELVDRIAPLLGGQLETVFGYADFVPEGGLLVAKLTEEQATRPIEYFLSIKSEHDPDEVVALVEDRIKFRLDSQEQLAKRMNAFGVKLKYDRAATGLPTPANVNYFRLKRAEDPQSKMAWERIGKSRIPSLFWPNMNASPIKEVKLFWVMP